MRRRRETAEEWLERIGYCFHVPKCQDSAACRAKRAKEKPTKPKVFTGKAVKPTKLDWDE